MTRRDTARLARQEFNRSMVLLVVCVLLVVIAYCKP